jgi:tetratricopeptide (TPR) repeat protein
MVEIPFMKFLPSLCVIALLSLPACATVQSQGDFQAGRRALLRGETDNALSYFERVAQSDPAYVSDLVSPRRSIWTYVGRAHYNSSRYEAARPAFEKALARLSDDYIARMYLGLILVRPQAAPPPSNAFNLQEVVFALREGVEPKRVATLARGRGVAFDVTKETEAQLRTAGADAFLLGELRNMRAESAKPAKAGTGERARGAKELSSALSGLSEWLNYTVQYTTQGKFWDPSQELRKQIDTSSKQVAAQPADWTPVIANLEWLGYQLEEESDRARRDESAERDRMLRR